MNSPLGKSIIYFAYDNDKIVSARAMLPVYHALYQSFQPCDTVTHPAYQRRGLISALTKRCLSDINLDDALIFNFPNNKSYSAYIKLGWVNFSQLSKQFCISLQSFNCISEGELLNYLENKIDKEFYNYLLWRFIKKPNNIYRYSIKNDCLYISKGNEFAVVSLHGKQEFPPKTGVHYYFNRLGVSINKYSASISLKSQARVVCFANSNKKLNSLFEIYSPLAVMDTF
nr:hypothetical protein BCU00_12510 [Vibrio breoganii]